MLVCKECGEIFQEEDAGELIYTENLGEFSRRETWMTCPNCGSDDITDAEKCECCGEWFDPDELSYSDALDQRVCSECAKEGVE